MAVYVPPPRLEVVRNIAVHDCDLVAEAAHRGDSGDRNKRGDERIFDRIGPALASEKFR
jgi:hypothetical protein